MTLKDFHDLALHMGAKIAFNSSSTAVFNVNDDIFLTVEVSKDKLANLTPVEAASLLADSALLAEKFSERHVN